MSSAIYGLVLSMIICVTAVAIFTGHIVLLLIIVFTIIGEYKQFGAFAALLDACESLRPVHTQHVIMEEIAIFHPVMYHASCVDGGLGRARRSPDGFMESCTCHRHGPPPHHHPPPAWHYHMMDGRGARPVLVL